MEWLREQTGAKTCCGPNPSCPGHLTASCLSFSHGMIVVPTSGNSFEDSNTLIIVTHLPQFPALSKYHANVNYHYY